MPIYMTEFTRRYGPGDEEYDEEGITSSQFVGPFIVAANEAEAEKICSHLHGDPHGDSPLTVLGELDEESVAESLFDPPDLETIRKAQAAVLAEVAALIKER